jgi:hypothetical protein
MDFTVKFGYVSGYSFVFSAFQPSGAGRGIEQQPLPEIRPKGYYVATPITDLVVGDMILVYVLENVLWENDPVYILTEDYLYWEGDRIYWEGEWLISTDDIISDTVTWIDNPVGSAEYYSVIDFATDLIILETKTDTANTNIDLLIIGQQTVNNVYTEDVKPATITILKNL